MCLRGDTHKILKSLKSSHTQKNASDTQLNEAAKMRHVIEQWLHASSSAAWVTRVTAWVTRLEEGWRAAMLPEAHAACSYRNRLQARAPCVSSTAGACLYQRSVYRLLHPPAPCRSFFRNHQQPPATPAVTTTPAVSDHALQHARTLLGPFLVLSMSS